MFSHESTAKLRLNDSLWGFAGLQKKKSDRKNNSDSIHRDCERHNYTCHHSQHQLRPDSDAKTTDMKRTNEQIYFVLINPDRIWPVY